MPIAVTCPKCAARFNAPENAIGKKAKCGKCGETFVVAELLLAEPPKSKPATVAVAVRTSPAPPLPVQRPNAPVARQAVPAAVVRELPPVATKECPFCSEPILATAKKCKHCGEMLDVALRAAMAPTPPPQIIHQVIPFAPATAVHITNANNNVAAAVAAGPAVRKRWSPIVAFFLSALIPGLGQLYKGQLLNATVWFVATIIGYAAFIVPGLVLHSLCAIVAARGDPYQ